MLARLMRRCAVLLCTMQMMLPQVAGAFCEVQPRTLVDLGLQRAWLIQPNCGHPERPARLVPIPWKPPEPSVRGARAERARAASAGAAAPLIRPGMRVLVERQDGSAEIQLSGIALEGGGIGESILVRAGLNRAALRAVVSGPREVQLKRGGQE